MRLVKSIYYKSFIFNQKPWTKCEAFRKYDVNMLIILFKYYWLLYVVICI